MGKPIPSTGKLDYTHRSFSIFVKRGADATDKLQYPIKVATFVYLLKVKEIRQEVYIKDEILEWVSFYCPPGVFRNQL